MGGSHNVAMNVLVQASNDFKLKREQNQRDSYGVSKLTPAQLEKNLKSTGKFLAFIVTLCLCVTYYVEFKTYHAVLVKKDQLEALLKNPKARVATAKKGKEIMKKLAEKEESASVIVEEVASQKAKVSNSIEELIIAAKAKKIA